MASRRLEFHLIDDTEGRRVEENKEYDTAVVFLPLTVEEAKKLGITEPNPTIRVWAGSNDRDDYHR